VPAQTGRFVGPANETQLIIRQLRHLCSKNEVFMANKMKLRYKILLGLGAGFVLLLAVYVGLSVLVFHDISRAAVAYKPDCSGDSACAVWTQFRTQHPYPYQELAVKRLPDATLALIISEPPPFVSKADLDQLVKTVFGEDLLDSKRRKWTLLTDGWLEDLVLRVKVSNAALKPTIDDPLFRDRIALLCNEIFGTTYGCSLDVLDDDISPTPMGPPDLEVSPAELRTWITGSDLKWRALDDQWGTQAVTWETIAAQKTSGAFGSSDGSLVILTFPTNVLLNARSQPRTLDPLRLPFRMFAIASDCVLGGLWTADGQLAIIARARAKPLTAVQPLRFETFELLATQYTDELAQSYERNTIFAGKLSSGDYVLKDWAPIYLSGVLIDTEFGALLNTTDQLLKSWSEAGTVEYEHFNYPKRKAGNYPFGDQPLSHVLAKETGAASVTFNWNTTGFGVVVTRPEISVLASRQLGALPVTYLAGKQDDHVRDLVLRHEDTAYDYFATQTDANLERVVQYTTLYQLFRAIEKRAMVPSSPSSGPLPGATVSARAAATQVLADETAKLLDDLEAGKLNKSSKSDLDDLKSSITAFRVEHPEITNAVLARIVADRFSPDAVKYAANRQQTLQKQIVKIQSDQSALNQDIEKYNAKAGASTAETADLLIAKQSLDQRKSDLESREQALEQNREDPIDNIRIKTARIAAAERDLDSIRQRYLQEVPKDSVSSIKTPSIVVSWAGKDVLVSVGGHNLDAGTLRLEMTPAVSDVELKQTADGYVLRYNPSKADVAEANATTLAHAIEHDGIETPEGVNKVLNKSTEIRSRTVALRLPEVNPADSQPGQWSGGQLGSRMYLGKDAFVEDLRTVAGKNDCCVFVAQDDHGVSYVAEKNASPPPIIVTLEVRDTPSLRDYVKQVSARAGTENEKSIVFLDTSEAHVEALTLGLRESDGSGTALEFDRAVSQSKGANNSAKTDALVQRDLRGRPSLIERLSDVAGARGRDLLEYLGIVRPKAMWEQVQLAPLDADTTRGFLQELNWEPTRDGVPTAIKVSFGSGGGGEIPPDLSVIAGFDEGDPSLAEGYLERVHHENAAAASANGASLAQYIMGVKNDLHSLTDVQLKRLVVVVQDKQETKIFLSRREGGNGSPSGF
jgi:hypothetical protein